MEVNYAASVPGPGVENAMKGSTVLVRCLVLLWTGDYPAQCEVGKTIFNGIHPCRRCKLKGKSYLGMPHYCTISQIHPHL